MLNKYKIVYAFSNIHIELSLIIYIKISLDCLE